jgi:thiosulfate/3-mercaptopyruvate sulfurtransferase
MKRLHLALVLLCTATLWLARPALACPPASSIVSTAALARHLSDPNWVLVDIRSNEQYAAGHVPGSINMPFVVPFSDWITMSDEGLLLEVPDEAELFASLGDAGIRKSSTVVVINTTVGDGVPDAYPRAQTARVVTTLLYAGVRDARVLDGGVTKWVAEKRVLSADTVTAEPVEFDGRTQDDIFVSKEYVESRLGRPGTVILDARDADVYYGTVIESFAPRAGHIPTAKSLPAPLIWNDDGTYKSPLELWVLATRVMGIFPPREIIVYCGVGGYASGWWLVLRHVLGYRNVKFYDGSAQEWAADPDAPMVAFVWE